MTGTFLKKNKSFKHTTLPTFPESPIGPFEPQSHNPESKIPKRNASEGVNETACRFARWCFAFVCNLISRISTRHKVFHGRS